MTELQNKIEFRSIILLFLCAVSVAGSSKASLSETLRKVGRVQEMRPEKHGKHKTQHTWLCFGHKHVDVHTSLVPESFLNRCFLPCISHKHRVCRRLPKVLTHRQLWMSHFKSPLQFVLFILDAFQCTTPACSSFYAKKIHFEICNEI